MSGSGTNNGLNKPGHFLDLIPDPDIKGAKLPSIGDVLRFFLFHLEQKLHHTEIAKITMKRLVLFYKKIGLPTIEPNLIERKLHKLFDKYADLKRRSKVRSNAQLIREMEFSDTFDDLFDIASANALDSVDVVENVKVFLQFQRQKGRVGTMAEFNIGRRVGIIFIDSSDQFIPDEEIEVQPSASRGTHEEPTTSQIVDVIPMQTSELQDDTEKDDTEKDPTYQQNPERKEKEEKKTKPENKAIEKKHIIGPRVVKIIDRHKYHSGGVAQLVWALLKELDLNPKEFAISRSSIENIRKKYRKEIFRSVKENFEVARKAVVHFDGKLLMSITGNDKQERLAIKVTCGETDQFLGAPICNGTGIDIAATVFQALSEWKIKNKIEACVYDTTSSNTGIENGAAVFLESFLGRSLLHLPCRHHIFELNLKEAFENKVEVPSGSKVKIFQRFKSEWESYDKDNFKPGIDDVEVKRLLGNSVEQLKQFLQDQMNFEILNGVVRKDYFELLELAFLFLGGKLENKTKKELLDPTRPSSRVKVRATFRPPGADSHARCMSKAIYSLKIFLFRKQFKLTRWQLKGLAEFCCFVVKYYIKTWFQCPISVNAARNDLEFINEMIDFIPKDSKLATAIITKFSGHLWYLSEECVAMAFFDKNISTMEKVKMVTNLRLGEDSGSSSEEEPLLSFRGGDIQLPVQPASTMQVESERMDDSDDDTSEDCDDNSDSEDDSDSDFDVSDDENSRDSTDNYEFCERRVIVPPNEIIKSFKNKTVSDFVTKKTLQFFNRFGVSSEFLSHDPTTWANNQSWIAGRKFVKTVKVTNDTAERGVKLISDFLDSLTKQEKQTKYLLQVVSQSRKEFPSYNIRDLEAASS